MTDQVYAPIPNEQRMLAAIRKAWHKVSGTAAYRQGISVTITIVNSTGERRVKCQPSAQEDCAVYTLAN